LAHWGLFFFFFFFAAKLQDNLHVFTNVCPWTVPTVGSGTGNRTTPMVVNTTLALCNTQSCGPVRQLLVNISLVQGAKKEGQKRKEKKRETGGEGQKGGTRPKQIYFFFLLLLFFFLFFNSIAARCVDNGE
jgi:hypothetical protein